MELRNKYQYTYFIHTYLINKPRYKRYLGTLLKDERFKLKIFSRETDLEIYSYFLPKIRSFLFKTFDFNETKIEKLQEMPFDTKIAILSEYPCLTFEYDIKKDIQGKTIDRSSIFFKIEKVGIICFNTGICFMYLKTKVEESNRFGDILDFNYKFRDINQEVNKYDNIKVQSDCFEDIKEIKQFISEITGPNFDALKLNLNVERFYTYGYECVEQRDWNEETKFDDISEEFLKYINVLPHDSSTNIVDNNSVKIISKEKFSKLGISKMGINLFSSDIDVNNYTVLPSEYENQYFYTYILSLYLKVYLKKMNYDYGKGKNLKKTRSEFIEFIKNLWIQEVTSEDFGSLLYQELKVVLGIERLYNKVKNKYDILYKELKFSRTEKTTIFISVILVITLMFNILNWLDLL